jgi:hypothetical protein
MRIWDRVWRCYLDGKQWKWRWEWTRASGATNTGLLVRTWGTVRSIYHSVVNGASWFYIDDGSAAVSDFGDTGVMVYGDAEIEQGDYVAVTGISSTEPSNDDPSRLIRVIRTRGAGDVEVLAPNPGPPPVYPFSDEFDSPTLDTRWIRFAPWASGSLSLTERPGWLTLTPRMGEFGITVGQIADGEWEMEVKLTAEVSRDSRVVDQIFSVRPAYGPSYDGWWLSLPSPGGGANFHQTSTSISVCSKDLGTVASTTLYFRLRRSAEYLYGSFSTDGIDYSQEVQGSYQGTAVVLGARATYQGSVRPAFTFKVHIDYIRFTLVDGGGDQ